MAAVYIRYRAYITVSWNNKSTAVPASGRREDSDIINRSNKEKTAKRKHRCSNTNDGIYAAYWIINICDV